MMPAPSDRYGSAIELADELDRFLDDRPIVARRMPWWERSSRWIRSNRAVSMLASLLFLALAMAAVISILGQIKISNALDQEVIAKRSAENTAALATTSIDQVFRRFSSSAEASNVVLGATDFSAPAVDPKRSGSNRIRSSCRADGAASSGNARLNFGQITVSNNGPRGIA